MESAVRGTVQLGATDSSGAKGNVEKAESSHLQIESTQNISSLQDESPESCENVCKKFPRTQAPASTCLLRPTEEGAPWLKCFKCCEGKRSKSQYANTLCKKTACTRIPTLPLSTEGNLQVTIVETSYIHTLLLGSVPPSFQ